MTDFGLSQGISALAALFVVHLLVVASPGPAFLAVSRTAISSSRTAGVIAAGGLATGALIWAIATMFGLDVLFAGHYATETLGVRALGERPTLDQEPLEALAHALGGEAPLAERPDAVTQRDLIVGEVEVHAQTFSFGRPSSRSEITLRSTSLVPPPTVSAGANRKP